MKKKQNTRLSRNSNIDKLRVWCVGIVALVVFSTLILFSMTVYRKGDVAASLGSGIIAVVVLIFAVFLWKNQYTQVKNGFPYKDERSKKIEILAGYYTFLISIWFLLALSWASDSFIEFRDPSQALGAGILGMAIIFVLCWIWIGRKGVVM